MSDRPTPEVDANLVDISGAGATVHTRYVRADLARRLERQRDELLDFLSKVDAMACDDEYGSSDFRKVCRYDIPKAIAAAKTSRNQKTPPNTMSDRPTPETDKFASMWRTHAEWKIRAGNIERQRDTICEMYFGLLEDQIMAVRHRDELLHALQRIDPFPNDEIEESWNGNTVYCEITVADIRLIRAAIARVKGGGA